MYNNKNHSQSPTGDSILPFPEYMPFKDRLRSDLARLGAQPNQAASSCNLPERLLTQWLDSGRAPRFRQLPELERVAQFLGRDLSDYLAAPELARLQMQLEMHRAPPRKASPMGRHLKTRKNLAQGREYGTTLTHSAWPHTAREAFDEYVQHRTGATVRGIRPSVIKIADRPSELQKTCTVDIYAGWHGRLFAFAGGCAKVPFDDLGIHLWASAELVIGLVEDYRRHTEGEFYNSSAFDLIGHAQALLHPEYGWLPANPHFLSRPQFAGARPTTATIYDPDFEAPVTMTLSGSEANHHELVWREMCRSARQMLADHAQRMGQHNRLVGRSNLQQDEHVLGSVLHDGNPLGLYHQLNKAMLRLYESYGPKSVAQESAALDLALFPLLECMPGRIMQICAMKFEDNLVDNNGQHYRIYLPGAGNKGRRGKMVQAPVDITIPSPTNDQEWDHNFHLRRYITEFRPASLKRLGIESSPYVFLPTRCGNSKKSGGTLTQDAVYSRLRNLCNLATSGQGPLAGAKLFRKIGSGFLELEGRGDEVAILLRNANSTSRRDYRETWRGAVYTKNFRRGLEVIRRLTGR